MYRTGRRLWHGVRQNGFQRKSGILGGISLVLCHVKSDVHGMITAVHDTVLVSTKYLHIRVQCRC